MRCIIRGRCLIDRSKVVCMEIPKRIEKILDRREKVSLELACLNTKIDDWLESQGANLYDPEICDGVLTGCMIYAEPGTANKVVRDYIKNKL